MPNAEAQMPDDGAGKVRWVHWLALGVLVVVSAAIRLRGIDRSGIWTDEYYALYLTTGRGMALFDVPYHAIIADPPGVGFAGAPHWWHIWGSTGISFHPPVYHLILRGWVDLFGESDRTIRTLSVIFGVLGIVFLFDAVRLIYGPTSALLAAVMMAFSPIQIDYAQQARPYTLLALVGILICWLLIRIKKYGASGGRIAMLGVLAAVCVLIHYFAVGIIIGAGLYAWVDLPGATRRRTIWAIVAGAVFAAVVWAPQFWLHRSEIYQEAVGMNSPSTLIQAVVDSPQRLVIGRIRQGGWPSAIALAVLVFVLPAVDRRKRVWWFYLVCTLGVVVLVDLFRHSRLLDTDRYIFAAAPAVYAILASAAPTRLGKWVPAVACAAVVIFGIGRLQQGADYAVQSFYQIEDHRMSAGFLKANARPGDLVIFTGRGHEPAFRYFVACHYDGMWKMPIMLATDPLNDAVRGEVAKFDRVWVSGRYAASDVARILPGYSLADVHAMLFDEVGRLVPPAERGPTREGSSPVRTGAGP